MRKMIYNTKAKENVANIKTVSPLMAEILYSRGFKSEKEMLEFLKEPTISDLKFEKFKGEDEAANILKQAIKNNEHIVIYTDTDCDGAMSAVIGMMLLSKIGANVNYYANNKNIDGYGLCKNGIDVILEKYPDAKLILTADNGIAAMDISYAKEKGLAVVVTDHHEPQGQLPPADTIVDAKQQDCPSLFKEMCGAGVLFKVLRNLYEGMGLSKDKTNFVLPYVAIATVGDVVPLVNINRIIVALGVNEINNNPPLSVKLIKQTLGWNKIDARNQIAFGITPMINAFARMEGDVFPAIEMFLSEDESKIQAIIEKMIFLNEERKKIVQEQQLIVDALAEPEAINKVAIVQTDSIPGGIAGIIAGKIKEKYNIPAIVFGKPDDTGVIHGSARSIDGISIKDVLSKHPKFYESFGGHAKAAGLSIKASQFNDFKSEIIKEISKFPEEVFDTILTIDAAATGKDLTLKAVEELSKLEPFGEGFPPLMIGLNFDVTNVSFMGEKKNHLKCYDLETGVSVICWNGAEKYQKSSRPLRKAIGAPSINEFNGKKSVQFIVNEDMLYPEKK